MSTLFQSTAIYRFSPTLNKKGDTTRRDGKSTEWWLILDCDREIGRYFRYLFAVHHHQSELDHRLKTGGFLLRLKAGLNQPFG